MTTLRADVERLADGTLRVTLHGALDERSDLGAIFGAIDADVALNLRRVERINSIGIHKWVTAIGPLSEERRVWLEEIPYPLVLSANAVANLFGQATPVSCMAPYFCERCGDSRTEVVQTAEVSAAGVAPARTCSVCGGPLAFDELDTYFRFLRVRRPR